jgi:hypothetical protein
LPFNKFEYVISWLYRESICFYLFIKAASNPTVKWRDGKYRLKWGGLAEEIKDINKKETKLLQNSQTSSSLSSNNSNKKGDLSGTNVNNLNNSTTNLVNLEANVNLNNNNFNKSNLLASSSINKSSNNLAQMTNNSVNKLSNQNHKRTNSYTIMMNNSNNSNKNFNSFDLEINANNVTKNSHFIPAINNYQKSLNHFKSNHQHHHSISSPLASSPFHQPLVQQHISTNTGALIDIGDSKFSSYKIV